MSNKIKEPSKRNLVRQVINNADGTTNVVFHAKKFHDARYGSHKDWWKQINSSPKPNSKRQQKLRESSLLKQQSPTKS